MASEKVFVTSTTESFINDVDAELQGRDRNLAPVDAASKGMLEVRPLNFDEDKDDKTDWAMGRGTSICRL